jgi:hypothetical protein
MDPIDLVDLIDAPGRDVSRVNSVNTVNEVRQLFPADCRDDSLCILDAGVYNGLDNWVQKSAGDLGPLTAREQGNAASSIANAWLQVSRLP